MQRVSVVVLTALDGHFLHSSVLLIRHVKRPFRWNHNITHNNTYSNTIVDAPPPTCTAQKVTNGPSAPCGTYPSPSPTLALSCRGMLRRLAVRLARTLPLQHSLNGLLARCDTYLLLSPKLALFCRQMLMRLAVRVARTPPL